ncbi:hypothetical protein PCE1_004560 [Barthelona sp. PCE]
MEGIDVSDFKVGQTFNLGKREPPRKVQKVQEVIPIVREFVSVEELNPPINKETAALKLDAIIAPNLEAVFSQLTSVKPFWSTPLPNVNSTVHIPQCTLDDKQSLAVESKFYKTKRERKRERRERRKADQLQRLREERLGIRPKNMKRQQKQTRGYLTSADMVNPTYLHSSVVGSKLETGVVTRKEISRTAKKKKAKKKVAKKFDKRELCCQVYQLPKVRMQKIIFNIQKKALHKWVTGFLLLNNGKTYPDFLFLEGRKKDVRHITNYIENHLSDTTSKISDVERGVCHKGEWDLKRVFSTVRKSPSFKYNMPQQKHNRSRKSSVAVRWCENDNCTSQIIHGFNRYDSILMMYKQYSVKS